MIKKRISTWIGLIILVILMGASMYIIYYGATRGELQIDPEKNVKVSKTADPTVREVKKFTIDYLDAYKNAAEKQNFEEITGFISDSAFAQMQREGMPFDKNFTDFDDYEIIGIEKANHEEYAPMVSGYIVQVKLLKGGQVLMNSQEEAFEINVIKENGHWRTPSWYFVR